MNEQDYMPEYDGGYRSGGPETEKRKQNKESEREGFRKMLKGFLNRKRNPLVYVLTRILLFLLIILLLYLGFHVGLNSMMVYTLAKDAMTLRTTYALQPDKVEEGQLEKYFTDRCIENDEVLSGNRYENYSVTNYYDRVEVDAAIIWPWTEDAEINVLEQIMEMTGTFSDKYITEREYTEEDLAEIDINLPEWKNGEYCLSYIKDGDSWKIDEIKYVGPAEDRMLVDLGEETEEEQTDTRTPSSGAVIIETE